LYLKGYEKIPRKTIRNELYTLEHLPIYTEEPKENTKIPKYEPIPKPVESEKDSDESEKPVNIFIVEPKTKYEPKLIRP